MRCASRRFFLFFGAMLRSKALEVSTDWIQAQNSAIHGRGIYAHCDIPSGTKIIEYVGERITKAEAVRREAERLGRKSRGEDASIYIFVLNRRYDLDGRGEANLARLINHSCRPNCRAETIRGRIWIFAKRDIPKGVELTFDYGFPYSQWPFHPCRCGAKDCAKFIVDSSQRWRVRRIFRGLRNAEAIEEMRATHARRLKKSPARS
jgi:uncharacterized protein